MKIPALALAATLATGCVANVAYLDLHAPPHELSRRSADSVELFTAAAPARAFVEVGMFEGRALLGERATPWIDGPNIIRKLRQAAADRGCDGLVVTSGDADLVRGTCIVYSAPEQHDAKN
jgi:hypothetical protein